MVVVPGISRTQQAVALPSRRRVAAPGAFNVPKEAQAPTEAAPAGAAALSGLLALQEAVETSAAAAAQDRAAQRHGEAVIGDLAALQLALLSGRPASAARLAAQAGAGPQAADPRLAAVLGAIRLRAEVELARAALRPGSDTENPSATRC